MNQPANVNIIPNVSVPPPNIMASMGMPDVNPGSINVIGNANPRRSGDMFAKENTIQVPYESTIVCQIELGLLISLRVLVLDHTVLT